MDTLTPKLDIRPLPSYGLFTALAAGIFLFDILTPQSYAVWIFYLVPLLLLSREFRPSLQYAAAGIFALLMALSLAFTTSAVPIELAVYNHLLGFCMLLIATFALAKHYKTDLALEESEKRFRRLFYESPIGAALITPDFRFIALNETLSEITGYPAEELASLTFPDFTYPEDLEEDLANVKRLKDGEIEQYEMEKRFIRKDGSIVWGHLQARAIRDDGGRLLYFMPVVQDITDRKRTEESLRALLEEKDILMRELSHRTKNNMQVIVSLLQLQAAESGDENLTEVLVKAQDRIHAMAMVYEKLYRSGSVSSLNLKEYAKDLVSSLLMAHQGAAGPVQPVLELEEVILSLDAVLPCGLIINELVSNSLKHAFPRKKAGNIFISLRRLEEKLELRYRDDGPGLPKGLDLSKVNSLGLKLVYNLAVRQLRGTMELVVDPGTEFVFRFPLPARSKSFRSNSNNSSSMAPSSSSVK